MKKIWTFLLVVLTSALSIFAPPVSRIYAITPADSTFFSTAYIEECDTYNTASYGDLWPSAWASDDNLYSANGDGKGFGTTSYDIVVNKITGHPDTSNVAGSALTHTISQVWSGSGYNRKPTGMVAVDGNLYCAVQDLATDFNDAPAATICKSTDNGSTWTWDTENPMFGNYVFTTIMFLDYGKNYANSPDNYVYAYGIDYNWRDSFDDTVTDPTKLYLARVSKTSIMTRSSWEFYTGDLNGNPSWSSNISEKTPVLQDDRRVYTNTTDPNESPKNMTVISQGSIIYNAPLDRYIYTSWTEYTYEFYEAPNPWGPWKKFLSKDYGVYPWFDYKNGGYSATIPSKYISTDGKTMYVQSNTFMSSPYFNNYNFSLRKLKVEKYVTSTASNTKNNNNLALPAYGLGSTPICKGTHYGKISYLNDGVLTHSEDSWDGEAKTSDWWGYTWKKKYSINRVIYTTGNMYSDGGWFTNLKVQVRQNFNWVDVSSLVCTPTYPNNNTAGTNMTYSFKFNDTWGDGVRIIGTPGGTQKFTSIGELEVYYTSTIVDGFSGPLNSAWTWSVPLSGPTYSFVSGNFRMTVPDTKIFDQWTFVDNAPKLKRTDMGSGSWTIETKLSLVSYTAGTNFHEGLMVRFGTNNYYIWGNLKGTGLELSRSGYANLASASYSNSTVYLRLRKVGTTYYADYKQNPTDSWTNAGSDTYAGTVDSVGLICKTWSYVSVTTDYDYFILEK